MYSRFQKVLKIQLRNLPNTIFNSCDRPISLLWSTNTTRHLIICISFIIARRTITLRRWPSRSSRWASLCWSAGCISARRRDIWWEIRHYCRRHNEPTDWERSGKECVMLFCCVRDVKSILGRWDVGFAFLHVKTRESCAWARYSLP